jgi:hypothetical protein
MSVVSWSARSSTNQSCHWPKLPSSRMGALSDVFFLRFQHWEPPDFRNIAAKAGLGRHTPMRGRHPNHDLHRIVHDGTMFNYFRNHTIDV